MDVSSRINSSGVNALKLDDSRAVRERRQDGSRSGQYDQTDRYGHGKEQHKSSSPGEYYEHDSRFDEADLLVHGRRPIRPKSGQYDPAARYTNDRNSDKENSATSTPLHSRRSNIDVGVLSRVNKQLQKCAEESASTDTKTFKMQLQKCTEERAGTFVGRMKSERKNNSNFKKAWRVSTTSASSKAKTSAYSASLLSYMVNNERGEPRLSLHSSNDRMSFTSGAHFSYLLNKLLTQHKLANEPHPDPSVLQSAKKTMQTFTIRRNIEINKDMTSYICRKFHLKKPCELNSAKYSSILRKSLVEKAAERRSAALAYCPGQHSDEHEQVQHPPRHTLLSHSQHEDSQPEVTGSYPKVNNQPRHKQLEREMEQSSDTATESGARAERVKDRARFEEKELHTPCVSKGYNGVAAVFNGDSSVDITPEPSVQREEGQSETSLSDNSHTSLDNAETSLKHLSLDIDVANSTKDIASKDYVDELDLLSPDHEFVLDWAAAMETPTPDTSIDSPPDWGVSNSKQ